jgi:hypothetical protein
MRDARVLEALAAAGFHGYVPANPDDVRQPTPRVREIKPVPVEQGEWGAWTLDPGQSRIVMVRCSTEATSTVWKILVEEWRGGEGYEADELCTTNVDELIAALPRWVAWAREPWVKRKPTTWGQRFCAFFGIPWD